MMKSANQTANASVLNGITVLELGARLGVSVAGSLMAQLGAKVVFVEAVNNGDFAQPKWQARDQLAVGKMSLRVDASSHEDKALLASLAAGSDVILRSSDVDALAFGVEPLVQLPTTAVVCDLTAFGSSGPMKGLPATDAQIQALTGIMDATGDAGAPPQLLPLPLVEHLAGVYAAAGVLAALRSRREQPNHPPPVEIALYDVAFSAMTSFLAPALSGAVAVDASRMGNRHGMAAPWNVYRAQDGWLLLCAGNDEQWERICGLIDQRERGLSPRFARNADRVLHVDEVDAMVRAWTGLHSIAQCVEQLLAQGIPCGPIAPMNKYPREANLEHRHMVLPAQTTHGRSFAIPGSPFRMSNSPGKPLQRVPEPDEDRATLIRNMNHQQVHTSGRGATIPAQPPASPPLAGLRIVEIGHYTTAPVAARLLAALGAEVIKVEPSEGEAVRRWPPSRNGQGIFFTFQNADKRSLVLDMNSDDGAATLKRLIASSDVLIENLRPGALDRKGFGSAAMLAINPRLVYCSISGFGADSIYKGRPAFDAVIQAMSGMMDINRVGDMPLKTGPSMADVIGAAFGLTAILAALEYRQRSGVGQFIDLSMQDICAWTTQVVWNDASPLNSEESVEARGDHYVLAKRGSPDVPVRTIQEVVQQAQTLSRRLWALTPANGQDFYVIASPVRVGRGSMAVPRPGPTLGKDTESILEELI